MNPIGIGLSISPDNKYQFEGGPGISDCLELIKSCSSTPALDYQKLIDRVIFNYIIGNCDAHAKNFAWLKTNNKISLSPAYDLVSTSIYEGIGPKIAMKIGGRYSPDELQARHWERLVLDTSSAKKMLWRRVARLCEKVSSEIEDIETTNDKQSDVILKIKTIIEQRILRLRSFL